MSTYPAAIRALLQGDSLSRDQSAALMNDLMEGLLDPPQVAAVLTALAAKGESADELAGFAAVMRRHALTIDAQGPVLDTCGTGGSGLETINTSTLAGFIVAAAGIKVAKHGNRASSGRCGSMDVLELLGVNIELTPATAERLIRSGPIVFMYARRHHPALGQVTPVRRSLAFRTCFNFLGPICNPAGAQRQVMGVSDPKRAPLLLDSLRQLGSERAMVVCAEDGLDEISICGPTLVWELEHGTITDRVVTPSEFGLDPLPFDEIAGGGPRENAEHFMNVLGCKDPGPRTLHTAINAGAGLYIGGVAESLRDGFERSLDLIATGAALAVFENYRSATQEQE